MEKLERLSLLRFDTQYLAHPAEFEKEAKVIQKQIEALGINILNPFGKERKIAERDPDWTPMQWWESPHSPQEAQHVVERDLKWIRESDALFAFVPKPKGFGTIMEIFYAAKLLEKPVFIYTSNKFRFHPWLMYYGQVFTDLSLALDVLRLRKELEGFAFRIAIGGKMGTGKSSISDFLAKCFQFTQYSFAAKLKEIASDLFDMEVKDRVLLQMLGSEIRNMKVDAWANFVMKRINAEAPLRVVIDDMRYLNEADILKENGFVLIKLYTPAFLVKKRHIAGFNQQTNAHPSEVEIDAIDIDYAIDTSGTLEQAYRKVMEVLAEVAEK